MQKTADLAQILAKNLKFFMARDGAHYRNANALGIASGLSPNTIRNILDPAKRPVRVSKKAEGAPTLDKLTAIAAKLPCQVWELLHPDIEHSIREREMYARIERDFKEQTKRPAEVKKQDLIESATERAVKKTA